MLATRARALIDGRLAPSVDDVAALAEPILKHRMALTFAARADGETIGGVIGRNWSSRIGMPQVFGRSRTTELRQRLGDQGARSMAEGLAAAMPRPRG